MSPSQGCAVASDRPQRPPLLLHLEPAARWSTFVAARLILHHETLIAALDAHAEVIRACWKMRSLTTTPQRSTTRDLAWAGSEEERVMVGDTGMSLLPAYAYLKNSPFEIVGIVLPGSDPTVMNGVDRGPIILLAFDDELSRCGQVNLLQQKITIEVVVAFESVLLFVLLA